MKLNQRIYIAIDLKSFYASVECVERGLDPLNTNLVVADSSRTEKTICLAVTPSLKEYGISGRARLFEVNHKLKELNDQRRKKLYRRQFSGKSYDSNEINQNTSLEIGYIIAPPRMAYYIEYSTKIYNIYLRYFSPSDIHVYSIDEVFIDITSYLSVYQLSASKLAQKVITDVLKETGITATVGIGTNLYLAKIAMDIVAKKIKPDQNGVRIASLNEKMYRKLLWDHRPLTDFWRIGKGYEKKLEENGIYTMGDIARCSLGKPNEYYNESLLYDLFGVNAELLIDHAWGYEPCTIDIIKSYKPTTNSVGSGQVLHSAYTFEKAKIVLKEMIENLVLDLVDKGLVTSQIVLVVGYDISNLHNSNDNYDGKVTTDPYGRKIPKHARATVNLDYPNSSIYTISTKVVELYENIVNRHLLIRRINISANKVIKKSCVQSRIRMEQLDLFSSLESVDSKKNNKEFLDKEEKIQQTIVSIKKKYGKNSILKGTDLEEGATARDRNKQIGGHKA